MDLAGPEPPFSLLLLDIHRDESYGCAYFQLLGLLCDKLCLCFALLIFRLTVFLSTRASAKKSGAFQVLASSCWRNLRRRQRRHTPWYNPNAPFAQIRVRCGLLNAAVGERRDLIVSSRDS